VADFEMLQMTHRKDDLAEEVHGHIDGK
jgi:hypothetical protein